MFWKHITNVQLAEKTKLYSVQRKDASLNTTRQEIEQLIGLQMYMSLNGFPTYRMYWGNDTRYPHIADIMPRNSY